MRTNEIMQISIENHILDYKINKIETETLPK